MDDGKRRCEWGFSDPLLLSYHDHEWGKPVYDDRKLFENFVLDGFQAGLSWMTILRKREAFRAAFDFFDMEKIAAYDQSKIDLLLQDPGIIRNRQKILAAVNNAKKAIEVKTEFGSFSHYIWQFSGGEIIQNAWTSLKEVPATSPLSDKMAKDMKKRGFAFAGSTICYAFLQAVGVVNDHVTYCFCY